MGALRHRIIVVDDDPDCLAVVRAALKEFDVLTLSDGDALWGHAEAFRPDVVILDVQLGGADGFELCRALKSREPTRSVPILFLSGLTEDAAFHTAFRAGGSVFVTKPLDPSELRRAVADLVRGR